MGILPGVEVEVLRRAPLGGPVEIALDGFALSLMQDAGVEQRVTIPSNGVYAVTITSQGPALTDETRNGAGIAENAMILKEKGPRRISHSPSV